MALSNIQKFGIAALSLVTVFGAAAPANAQSFEVKQSPDKNFQQCISKEQFPQAIKEMGQEPVAAWNAQAGTTKTWYIREMLTMDTRGSNLQKKWITWTGWHHDQQNHGRTPEMFCLNTTGKGITYLNNELPEKMPETPFGLKFKQPANSDMGSGAAFIANYIVGRESIGQYPTILLNNGNGTFSGLYVDSNGEMTRASTISNGATKGTTGASKFVFDPNAKIKLASNELQKTASLSYSSMTIK